MTLRIPQGLIDLQPKLPVEVNIKLPRPYHPWQSELVGTNVKLAVYALGTKAGKTMGGSIRLGGRSFTAPGAQEPYFRILAPYFRHSRITWKYLDRLIPAKLRIDSHGGAIFDPAVMRDHAKIWEQVTPDRSYSNLTMRWAHNNALIECMHGQQPDAIEGERVHGQIIDEAAKLKEAAFAAAMSTTTQTGGWTICISTPKGKNWFYKLAMECQQHEQWCKEKGIPPQRIFRTIPTSISPFVSKEVIENARRTLPKRLYDQLYEAQFVDDGAVFTELNHAFQGATEFIYDDKFIPDQHISNQVFVGVDFAKSLDYTVFYAINDQGENVGYWRIQKESYPAQVAKLFYFIERLQSTARQPANPDQQNPKCEVMTVYDKTGVGEAVGDIINATNTKGYAIEGLTWTNSVKEIYVNDLILSLEEHILNLKPWGTFHYEMTAFEVETSAAGNPIFGAPDGQHDDTVMSAIIANKLFREYRREPGGVLVIDTLQNYVQYLHYNVDDLLDDID